MKELFKTRLNRVKAFFLDVDGVLTDGSLLVMTDGELLRSMNIKDGFALKLAVQKGYHVIVISGGHSKGVEIRLQNLGIRDVYISVQDKLEIFEQCCSRYQLSKEQTLYMGDDLPDLEVIQLAGIAACPSDAVHQIKSLCQYISPYGGGRGCVRDVIEQTLTLQGHWPD